MFPRLLLPSLLLLLSTTTTIVSTVKVSWPALEIRSDDFFDPLMTSFSKFPFHDIYETPSAGGADAVMLPPSQRAPSSKTFREWSKQFPLGELDTSTEEGRSRLCEFISMFPLGRDAGRRRFLPLKLRKLLKYCSASG